MYNVVLQIVNFVTFVTDTMSSPQPEPIILTVIGITLSVAMVLVLSVVLMVIILIWKVKQVQYLACIHVFLLQLIAFSSVFS